MLGAMNRHQSRLTRVAASGASKKFRLKEECEFFDKDL